MTMTLSSDYDCAAAGLQGTAAAKVVPEARRDPAMAERGALGLGHARTKAERSEA